MHYGIEIVYSLEVEHCTCIEYTTTSKNYPVFLKSSLLCCGLQCTNFQVKAEDSISKLQERCDKLEVAVSHLYYYVKSM